MIIMVVDHTIEEDVTTEIIIVDMDAAMGTIMGAEIIAIIKGVIEE